MKPVLYAAGSTAFISNGVGVLADCISCFVTEERNSLYELEIEYPSNGIWADDIEVGCIIKAKANDTDAPQLFQIYDVVRTLAGAYTVKAEHISYRLSGVPVKPYSATGAANALAGITSHAVIAPGFTFSTDMTSAASFSIDKPMSARAILGGAEGSLLDTYGGEYHFDNFEVKWLKARGADNGVSIRYGKNMTELEQDINGAVYNGIFPYWYRENEGVVYPSSAVPASGSFPVACYEVLDLTNEFKTKPTAAQLTTRANQLVSGMGSPVESIDVSFVTLHQMGEYATIAALEHVSLCDIVTVIYDALGINVKTKVVKTVYNTLTELYESITVGSLQTSLADLITEGMRATDSPTLEDAFYTRQVVQADNISISASGGHDTGFTSPSATYTESGITYQLVSTTPINVSLQNATTNGTGSTSVLATQIRPGGCYLRNLGTSAAKVKVTAYYLYQRLKNQ